MMDRLAESEAGTAGRTGSAERPAAGKGSGDAAAGRNTGGRVALCWAVLTVAALGLSYLLPHLGVTHNAVKAAVWGTYNLIGWSVTLRALRRSRRGGTASRQTLEAWAVATVAVWAVVATSTWSEALPEWAMLPMIQIILGVSLVSTGATVRDGATTLCGLVLVVSAPVLLALGEEANPGLWSLLVSVAGIGVAVVTISLTWRRNRIAVRYRTGA